MNDATFFTEHKSNFQTYSRGTDRKGISGMIEREAGCQSKESAQSLTNVIKIIARVTLDVTTASLPTWGLVQLCIVKLAGKLSKGPLVLLRLFLPDWRHNLT